MAEYYQLQQRLLRLTLGLAGVVAMAVWAFYSLNTALNYLLGAGVGLAYLRLLAKDVERLDAQSKRVGSKGLALFAGAIVLATQWQDLHVVPVFLGFLTYKGAILIYMLQGLVPPPQQSP